jgi:hypothetical protein
VKLLDFGRARNGLTAGIPQPDGDTLDVLQQIWGWLKAAPAPRRVPAESGMMNRFLHCNLKTSASLSDKRGMTISNAAVQGIQSGESLLDRTAARIANSGQPNNTSGDQVSLSSDAVALLDAKNQIAASASALHADNDMRKTLSNLPL